MQFLRYGTTTYSPIGPAVGTGGSTPVTTLTSSNADEAYLIKHNSTSETTMGGLTAYSSADGYYAYGFTTGETDTCGRMTMVINDDDLVLPLRLEFMVVPTNVYDSFFASSGTDVLDSNIHSINETTVLGTGQSTDKWRG